MVAFVNELHYDNAGTDAGEAIEIAGTAGTNLAGWSVVFYNGGASGGPTAAVSYRTLSLTGTIADQSNGYGTLSFTLPVDGIQNGASDGFALVNSSNQVVQFLSYEGVITASNGAAQGLTSLDIGVSENGTEAIGNSLRLTGSGTQYSDFTWASSSASSFGAVNQGQSFGAGSGTTSSFAIGNASAAEGNSGTSAISFTVTRSGDTSAAGAVNYATVFDGTATAGDLSGTTSGTLSFGAGEASKTITLQVVGDTTYESDETFHVTLSNASTGASISASTGTGTIVNDDAAPPPTPLFINEIHYDNFGTDTGEAIEIAGPAGTSLAGWSLVLYNGGNGQSYSTTALTGTIADQNNGYGTSYVTYPVDGIQNGSPDAIALVAPNGTVVQFLSYEGVMTAVNGPAAGLTSNDIGVTEESPVGYSLQLSGTGAVAGDFTWQQAAQNSFGQVNAGQSFLPATGPGYLRVGDASVQEGDSGTSTLSFQITRSGGSSAAATVDYAINFTGTANAADVAPGTPLAGTLSFGVGEVSKTVTVGIAGDVTPEPNETLSLSLSNPTGATFINDGVGVGTIINDDPIALRTFEIQGAGHTSEYVGQRVTTSGIVTAVGTTGFYVQDATGDGNAATSDAVFVATTARASVAVGTAVTVSGTIAESGSAGQLTVTGFAVGATVAAGTAGNTLPAAVVIGHDGLHPPTEVIDNDGLSSFDPTSDGIDFYESLEGMRVIVQAPQVVARTESSETWVVASGGQDATGMNAAGGITIAAGDFNPERILIDPQSDVFSGFSGSFTQGDRLSDVTGVIGYGSSSSADPSYKLIPTAAATLTQDLTLEPEVTALKGDATHLTIASFNMENADVGDGAAKFQLLADTVVTNLQAPDIIFAQEIQDADGPGAGTDYTGTATANALIAAIDAKGGPHYAYVEVAPTANNQNGGESNGNIRPGFFYNTERVTFVTGSATQITDAAFDGSRKPLVAEFQFNGQTITAIDVHSTSRLGSDYLFGSYQPPIDGGAASRAAQGQAIADYVSNLLTADPDHNIVVGGDFNGFQFEAGLQSIVQAGLTNLDSLIPAAERYSYLFDGNFQQIDHLLASGSLVDGAQFDAVHINTLKPVGTPEATDHDQVITRLYVPTANSAPIATGDAVAVDEDATTSNLYSQLIGNDTDPDSGSALAITAVSTNGTLGHVLFDADTRTLHYVADYDGFDTLASGATSTDSFTYTLSDGTLTSTATVTVTVTGVADGVTRSGGTGADVLTGTAGDDRIYGNAGNDSLTGGEGADFVLGGQGNDTLIGEAGRDYLIGGAGNDNLVGGAGDDYLSGEAGLDTLTGGNGSDTFVFGSGGSRDTVTDFTVSTDRLLLANGIAVVGWTASDVDRDGVGDITITFGGGSSAVLLGVQDFSAIQIDRTTAAPISDPFF